MQAKYISRDQLGNYEWDFDKKHWNRPKIDPKIIKELSQRSNLHGIIRVTLLTVAYIVLAFSAIKVAEYNFLLAIPIIYAYWFLFGFIIALAHELQHKIVFDKSLNWLSEGIYFIVQTLVWNGPVYARISHRLHHRYTMIRGYDPETPWPDVITSKWIKRFLLGQMLRILVVGAIYDVFKWTWILLKRTLGIKDTMMQDHCTDKQIKMIRLESAFILLFHYGVIAVSIWLRLWQPIVFITIAWHVGWAIEGLWHNTEHIERLYNANDFRLCTRSIRVSPFTRLIYGGLDDHVDHHMFPGVTSRNLPKLHKLLADQLPQPKTMIQCWKEMLTTAKEKDKDPNIEYVPETVAVEK